MKKIFMNKRATRAGLFNKFNMLAKARRSQNTMSLPFGMIFSIILIVVFIVVAFIAIKHFLDIGDCAKVGQFYGELQKKVDDAWRSQESSFEISISLPSGLRIRQSSVKVCSCFSTSCAAILMIKVSNSLSL